MQKMSSISCWTSATRCSNNLVSHPTSNSYPYLHFLLAHSSMEKFFPIIHVVCRAPMCVPRLRSRIRSLDMCRRIKSQFWMSVRDFEGDRRRHFEVEAIMRTRGRILWPTAGSAKHSILSFRFTRFICPCSLSLAYSVSAFYLTSTSPTRHAP